LAHPAFGTELDFSTLGRCLGGGANTFCEEAQRLRLVSNEFDFIESDSRIERSLGAFNEGWE
jgi:hypothetical protein